MRRRDLVQAVFALDGAHDDFLAPVIVAVRGDAAVKPDPVGQNVDVFMLGVAVPGHQVLVMVQTHILQIALADAAPLRVT